MANIPGVPDLSVSQLPSMSPREAGMAGNAIAGLGEESLGLVSEGQALQQHIKRAQQHVDMLAARNQLDAAYTQMQDDLAKTQNSREIPEVIESHHKALNDIARQWQHSPAAMEIQMDADALGPSMQHIGLMRQIDLMGKEFKITLAKQGEVFAQNYASARSAGDQSGENAALSAFTDAVRGGVQTGLMGDIEAQETVRLFRKSGQELQIQNAIANPDPNVNQAVFDEINAHPEKFPDVQKEFLENAKEKAITAKEAHIKHQEWADGQMALNTMLRPLINEHINPATGKFDEDAALADIGEQFRSGKITVFQKDALDAGTKSYGADVNAGLKKKAIEIQDSIIKDMHDRQYSKAYSELEKAKPWFENSGYSELYKGLMNYGDTMQRQDRSEAREERSITRQEWQDQSFATFVSVQSGLSQGKTYKDSEIFQMAGHGAGKMLPQQVTEALQMVHSYQKDPSYQASVDLLRNSLMGPAPPVKGASPSLYSEYATGTARNNERQILTLQRWQQLVKQHPNEDKLKLMGDALQPAVQQDIAERLDQMFPGTAEPTISLGQRIKGTIGVMLGIPSLALPQGQKTPERPKGIPEGAVWNPKGNNGKGSWQLPAK